MKKLFLIFTIAILSETVFAGNHTISGYITDQKTGESLISTSVYDVISQKGAVSNVYGFYSLTIPTGEAEIQYTYVGYKKEVRKFSLNKDTVINIQLSGSHELGEITITSEPRKEFGVLGSQMGAIQVPISQIKAIPTLFGEADVLKALQLLPGVKSGTEGSAGLYVRGGGPDENLLLLDGIPVYNVNHLFGFLSVFNADAIKNVTLYKGNFPARFGGRLSSVVDIQMNDGNNKEFHGNFTVGLLSSKFNLEGPIIKEKTTFNFSARRSYIDIVAKPFIYLASKENGNSGKSTAGYYFYDLNTKISHKISDKDRLFLSLYSGDDAIYANMQDKYNDYQNTTETNMLKLNWKWGNLISALRWNHVISNKLFMNTTASYTRYRFYMDISETYETITKNPASIKNEFAQVGYDSGIKDYTGKVDFEYSPNPNHDIKFGANYTNHTFSPGVSVIKENITNENDQIDKTFGDKDVFAHETMLYAEDNITLGTFIKANVGLHYSTFYVQNQFYNSLQPRLSLRMLINDKLSFKVGYASMSQYIHLLSNSTVSLPTDLWVPVTKRISPMVSKQYSAGFFYNLLDLADLSLEGYYKSMNNLIEYQDGATFMGPNTGWEDKVFMGRGWAYGVEFLAQKSYGKTTGWLGYTWAKSERLFDRPGQEINNGKVFPAKYDRRHDVSLTISHKLSERIDIAGTWVYSTGHCGTLALQNYNEPVIPQSNNSWQSNSASLPYVSSRNNYRFNAYHRMDIGINFHKKLHHGIRTWNISVYNVYNQQNPFLVYPNSSYTTNPITHQNEEHKTLRQVSIFPVIPSISYSYAF
jgi:TonB-dependent Receptor Plug Domain/CarboxypepD_reg-like domain